MIETRSQKRKLEACSQESINKKICQEQTELESEFQTETDTDTETEPESESEMETEPEVQLITFETLMETVPKKRSMSDDEYANFNTMVESIYDGDFFERIPLENRTKRLKQNFSPEEMKELNIQLTSMHENYKNTSPSIIDILKMKCPMEQKQKMLERLHHYANSEMLSNEYNSSLKFLTTNINTETDQGLLELEKEILKSVVNTGMFDSYKNKILKSKMSFQNKVIAYKKMEIMETYEDTDTGEYAKYKNWLDTLLSVPFGVYDNLPITMDSSKQDLQKYIRDVRHTLDRNLSFLEKPKDQVINIVSQMIRNPDCNINAIGLFGSRGVGKSELVASISEALGRPYRMISLGGESDASSLTGHGFTYIGSTPGRFIEILKETKTMNPIILVDELDKVSETNHGKEIIGTLIHLTDSTTNSRYNLDKYFSGIEFDLSKVLFVFTYNDETKIDPILADRLFKIKVDNYNQKEKFEITNKHLVSKILHKLNLNNIKFSEEAIDYLVQLSKDDQGMRNIKTKINIILTRINVLLLTDPNDQIINLKYKKLYDFYSEKERYLIPREHIDVLLDESVSTENKDRFSEVPFGMYI